MPLPPRPAAGSGGHHATRVVKRSGHVRVPGQHHGGSVSTSHGSTVRSRSFGVRRSVAAAESWHERTMPDGRAPGLARFAALLADTTRATFLLALVDGRAWTASELAAYARVAPSTATEHLNRLLDAGLLVQRRAGAAPVRAIGGPGGGAVCWRTSVAAVEPPRAPVTSLRAATVQADAWPAAAPATTIWPVSSASASPTR